MKLQLKGHPFDTTEEMHAESQEVIDTLTFENFQGCMKSWETGWDRCVHAQGVYFEGDSGNLELRHEAFFKVKFPKFLGSTSYMICNHPEQQISHLHQSRSLKSQCSHTPFSWFWSRKD